MVQKLLVLLVFFDDCRLSLLNVTKFYLTFEIRDLTKLNWTLNLLRSGGDIQRSHLIVVQVDFASCWLQGFQDSYMWYGIFSIFYRYSIGCQLCRRFWSSHFTRPSRSEFSVWRHRSSDSAGKITSRFRFFWSSTELGAIVFNRQVTTSLFQWNFVICDASDVWRSTGLGLRSITFYFVYSRNPVNCGKFWVSRAFLCRRPPDLCPLGSEGGVYTRGVIFRLCRCHQRVDGKQPFTAQSGQDGSYLAWFSTSPPPLPDDAHDHLWRNDQTIHHSSQSWCHIGHQLIDDVTCQ